MMDTNEDNIDRPDPRAAQSMAAFDAMPEAFRVFCANYARTANGVALAGVLAECDGRVEAAMETLRFLLPVRS
jgi:hypothetical protein